MSLEIKSVDVENEEEEKVITVFQSFGWKLKSSQRVFNQSSTPRGAISYENLTYIHSETQTIDFTKLVFERDTKMPNYGEIVELEEEFWELSSECPNDRPIEPELLDFKEWINKTKPSAFPKSKKIMLSILFYCALPILVSIISGLFGGITVGFFIFFIVLLLIPINVMFSYFLIYLCNSKILKQDLNSIDSTYYKELQSQYSEYADNIKALQEAAISYDDRINKMRHLIWKSENLL